MIQSDGFHDQSQYVKNYGKYDEITSIYHDVQENGQLDHRQIHLDYLIGAIQIGDYGGHKTAFSKESFIMITYGVLCIII